MSYTVVKDPVTGEESVQAMGTNPSIVRADSTNVGAAVNPEVTSTPRRSQSTTLPEFEDVDDDFLENIDPNAATDDEVSYTTPTRRPIENNAPPTLKRKRVSLNNCLKIDLANCILF